MAAGQGRCAGCGRIGKARAIQAHIVDCPDWQQLYRSDPARVLDPVPEYARWLAQDKQPAKDAARATVVAANTARKEAQDSRFARLPDPDLDS